MTDTALRPGSREAQAQGCECPVLDNEHGKGRGGDGERFGWILNMSCPVHGWSEPTAEDMSEDELHSWRHMREHD